MGSVYMPEYLSAVQTAKKWGITKRRVTLLCSTGRVTGASLVGKQWIIPAEAEKPSDPRRKSDKNEIPAE